MDNAPAIDDIGFFHGIASIAGADFGKAKIYKLFVDFCFTKITNYFLFSIDLLTKQWKWKIVNYFGKAKIYK